MRCRVYCTCYLGTLNVEGGLEGEDVSPWHYRCSRLPSPKGQIVVPDDNLLYS